VARLPVRVKLAFKTENVTPLLATPPTVTTTLPVVAPVGTVATIDVALQLVIVVAVVPLKVTVLVPCVEPKFVPVIVTDAPTAPDVGDRFVMLGVGINVKLTPLLAMPFTVTTTLPVVAPVGTVATIDVAVQLVGVAVVPLNVTVPVVPKFVPVMVICVPTGPLVGLMLAICGLGSVKVTALLVTPPFTTRTPPVVVPAPTVATTCVSLQL
jgi:hypothetical protein